MIMQRVAPGSVSCNAVRVVSMLTSMRGFVTSKRADTIFTTVADARRYIKGVDKHHPGLETHTIYDERDDGEAEYQAALDGIRQSTRDAGIDTDSLVEDWEYAVFEWLWDNEQGELEHDGDGAYPGTGAIERAVKALFDWEQELDK